MARYTFSVSPDYLGDDATDIGDVRYHPSVTRIRS
jgi:hypothetical protein